MAEIVTGDSTLSQKPSEFCEICGKHHEVGKCEKDSEEERDINNEKNEK